MATEAELGFDTGGDVRCIYDAALDLRKLGEGGKIRLLLGLALWLDQRRLVTG